MNTEQSYHWIIDAAQSRATGDLDWFTCAYVTDGGTWVLATAPTATDNNRPRDLIAVLNVPVEGSHIAVLRPTVHHKLVSALRTAFD